MIDIIILVFIAYIFTKYTSEYDELNQNVQK